MYIIKPTFQDEPYGKIITKFLNQEFKNPNIQEKGMLLDILTDAVVSTSKIRFAPIATPEILVSIRQTISNAIRNELPIPVLTPWGSRKAVSGYIVDVAELSALRQLQCLQLRVKQFYEPGVDVRMRMEDTSGFWLFGQTEDIARETQQYVVDMENLIHVLDFDSFIHAVRESQIFDTAEYYRTAESIMVPMLEYLKVTDRDGFSNYAHLESYKELERLGWKGMISAQQRDYYRNRYHTAYPGLTADEYTRKLANYFSGSLARIKLNGTGARRDWGSDYLRVTFVNPIPDAPEHLTMKNIYYRTIPKSFTREHMPPWRSRGYVTIDENGKVTPKIKSFGHTIENINFNRMMISNGGSNVTIQADYQLV